MGVLETLSMDGVFGDVQRMDKRQVEHRRSIFLYFILATLQLFFFGLGSYKLISEASLSL
jgi:hypothetical protein